MSKLAQYLFLPLLLLTASPTRAATLGDLLLRENIPAASFTSAELENTVTQSAEVSNPQLTELVYRVADSLQLSVVRLDKATGTVLQSKLNFDETDPCSGSLLGASRTGEFTLISTHVSPSAGCVLVLDGDLRRAQTLYGFGPVALAPDRILLTEDMVHFAPAHPERLQLANLSLRTTAELYPPQGDALRARLARENQEQMPPAQVCMQMNDPCDPKLFDESILGITVVSNYRFAFVVRQSIVHQIPPGRPSVVFPSQSVLYIYASGPRGWLYCEEDISDTAARAFTEGSATWRLQDLQHRCTPTLPVVPDMSTAAMNPFASSKP